MQRRDFLRSVIVGTLAAPFVTRQVECGHSLWLAEPKWQRSKCADCGIYRALRPNGVLVDSEHGLSMRYEFDKWHKASR